METEEQYDPLKAHIEGQERIASAAMWVRIIYGLLLIGMLISWLSSR